MYLAKIRPRLLAAGVSSARDRALQVAGQCLYTHKVDDMLYACYFLRLCVETKRAFLLEL